MNDLPIRTSELTHAQTAWLETAVPVWMTVGMILLCALLFRGTLRSALTRMLLQRAAGRHSITVEPALIWFAPIVSEAHLLGVCLLAAVALILLVNAIASLFIALLIAGPLVALLIWILLWMLEQQYISKLDATLPAAVGRLEAQMRGGSGLQTALQRVLLDMPPGPLQSEWSFIVAKLGIQLTHSLATPQQVVTALLVQTPSRRHATFLGHLEMALEQPHSAMVQRIRAAYMALQAAEQRRSAALTELSQMRYSGIAISLAGLTMALYLFATQQQRFFVAYQGMLGLFAGGIVVMALLAPLVGGYLLSQAGDLDY